MANQQRKSTEATVPDGINGTAWHALEIEAVLDKLQVNERGLTSEQAAARRSVYGANTYQTHKPPGFLKRLAAQIHNLLIYVLLAAALVTWLIDHHLDAAVILAVVILNVSIGLYQEGKAEKSLQAIRQLLAPSAQVWRNARLQTLPASDLVPGDIVVVTSGENLPGDLRWFSAINLRIDESALTGESVAADKSCDSVEASASLGDRLCMGYAGTIVAQGKGRGVVVATGSQTEMGRIGRLLENVQANETPLVRNMAQFSRVLTGAILVFAALLFGYAVWLVDLPLAEAFMAVVGLAVAAIPEGLPAILTITLAIGVQRMAKRHAVIRRLPAVETLGAVTTICSDKTGTLTRNEMTAQGVTLHETELAVTGVGYSPEGSVRQDENPVQTDLTYGEDTQAPDKAIDWLALTCALCNDASLAQTDDDTWQISGDPTEGALLTLAHKLGMDPQPWQDGVARLASVPFESEHQFMVTAHGGLHPDQTDSAFILLKGAPEKVLSLCTQAMAPDGRLTELETETWTQAIAEHAAQGRRVLGVAIKADARDLSQHNITEHLQDLTFVGLIGIMDPPREDAIDAVSRCQQAGITVKMITGDHSATALAISKQLGIGDGKHALAGQDIEQLTDTELLDVVKHTDVFARASPEHKIRIVRALQAQGQIVAMTGDGVNDSPALKQADIGIAMGQKGTEAAKQAAEIVLADDNFASIANAVEEGRTVYDNLKKTIAFLLPINGGESMAIGAAILLGVSLPITPLQILWINMVSSIGLALVLAFEAPEADIMARAPRDAQEPLLSRFLIWRILFVSGLFLIGIFGAYHWSLSQGHSLETARTMAVNALVSMEVFYLFSVRYLKSRSFSWVGVQGTPRVLASVLLVAVLQLAMTYWSVLQSVFQTTALDIGQLGIIVGIGFSVLLVLEIEKWLVRRRKAA
jgi:magnesium-transporting ATPase (P-type)